MKTTVLKLAFIASFSILLLSSCLKDNENSFEIGRDFAYITDNGYTTYAATWNGIPVTSPEIRDLIVGQCYFIGYKITQASGSSGGINNAETTNVLSQYPLPQTTLRQVAPPEGTMAVKSIDPSILYQPTDFLGDRWLFPYTASLREGETATAQFYYDVNNQKDQKGDPLKNAIVIDIRFIKDPFNEQGSPTSDIGLYAVGNFSPLRAIRDLIDFEAVEGGTDGQKYATIPIMFRYIKYENANEPAKVTYLGTSKPETSNYLMLFAERKY